VVYNAMNMKHSYDVSQIIAFFVHRIVRFALSVFWLKCVDRRLLRG